MLGEDLGEASAAVIRKSSYPLRVRETKRALSLGGLRPPRPPERLGPLRASRSASLALLLLGLSGAVALAAACLPDLAPLPAEDAGPDAGPPPGPYCGDGIIATLDDGGDAGESCDPGDASVRGCSECQVTCNESDSVLDPATGHCYFVFDKDAGGDFKLDDAKRKCTSDGAHVVTLSSVAEAELVDKLAAGAPYWIGLSYEPTVSAYATAVREPGFPDPSGTSPTGPCEGCFGVGAGEGGVVQDDPDASVRGCIVSRSDAGFRARQCSTSAAFRTICEREPAGLRTTSCIGGFCFNVVKTSGKKNYVLGVDAITASFANQVCRSLDNGTGRLAVLATAEEREEIAREILRRYEDDPEDQTYWIGLSSVGPDGGPGVWTWDDGVVASPAGAYRSPWGDREPTTVASGARAYLTIASAKSTIYDTQLAHADANDTKARRYICERVVR